MAAHLSRRPGPPFPCLAAILGAVLALAVAGCSSGASPGTGASGGPGTPPSRTTGGGAGGADPAAAIESIRIRPADAGRDTEVELVSQDATPAEPPSLDLCYARFDSESHRVARRLYSVAATEGTQVARNDVVIYDSPASAQQALTEARRAVASCPAGVPRQSTTSDQPPTRFQYAPLPADALSSLAPGALAVTEIATPASGQPWQATRIVQQQGPVLVIVDGYAGRAAALALARACARRLAALPPGAR